MSNASPKAGTTPVFRTITVGDSVTVALGEPLSAQAIALMEQIGTHRFVLKEGTFKRAAEIDVQLVGGAAVHKMDFAYAPGTDYAELFADFEAELGPPSNQAGGVATWIDSATEFRLVNDPTNIRSMLRDLAPGA